MKRICTLVVSLLLLLANALPSMAADMTHQELDTVVKSVLQQFKPQPIEGYFHLLVETAKMESDLEIGLVSRGNYGLWQLRLRTVQELLCDLKTSHPDWHASLRSLLNTHETLAWNLKNNHRFGAAMCLVYFMEKNPRPEQLATMPSRAALWKNRYNTSAGSGTVKGYMRRNCNPLLIQTQFQPKHLF